MNKKTYFSWEKFWGIIFLGMSLQFYFGAKNSVEEVASIFLLIGGAFYLSLEVKNEKQIR